MPSTPRLSTPDRSVTSSPMAAIRSGVEAVMMVRRMASNVVTGALSFSTYERSRGHRPSDDPQAVGHEGVGGEHAEQQHALEGVAEIEGQLEEDLRALAADEGQRHHERGDQDPERVEPPEERHRDGGEAV